VVTYSREAERTDPALLRYRAYGRWWDILATLGITLLVSREYEHLLTAMTVIAGDPHVTFMPMPHPSGLAVDRASGALHVASTRNPNQVFTLKPASGALRRRDVKTTAFPRGVLMPIASRFYPGCLYLHDLAFVGRALYANAVGQNAIAKLDAAEGQRLVWWPRSIERSGKPDFGRNHLQLNSIAAGHTLRASYFSASGDRIEQLRPGHARYPVDGRGVIFSGATREPAVRGLTRPHSARLHDGRLWVANSGYGELSLCDVRRQTVTRVATLDGWTRGLALVGATAFVGTSRVLPQFSQYAPGLDVGRSVCGVHAVNVKTGAIDGGLIWPAGNQVFAIDWMPSRQTPGFPFPANGRRSPQRERDLYYSYVVGGSPEVM
jgi:uncharacterized protein (TIGR03032 family)